MNSYIRYREAVAHRITDRVPCDFTAEPEVIERLFEYLGVKTMPELLRKLRIDRRSVGPRYVGPTFKKVCRWQF